MTQTLTWFLRPLNTKQVILETFFPANLLASSKETKANKHPSGTTQTSASAGLQDAYPTIRPYATPPPTIANPPDPRPHYVDACIALAALNTFFVPGNVDL